MIVSAMGYGIYLSVTHQCVSVTAAAAAVTTNTRPVFTEMQGRAHGPL